MLIELERRLRSMDFTLGSLRNAAIDEALAAMIFQHLCVRMSGNLEICITEILKVHKREGKSTGTPNDGDLSESRVSTNNKFAVSFQFDLG
jgi:hypothetical protein